MGKNEIILTIILFNLFFILFIVGILIFIQQYRLKKKEHLLMLQTQHEDHQKELLSTQLEIQNQTMQHIGREIHDNVGQKLTLASLYTQQLAFENKAPHINDSIENISNIINESLSELRELSKTLTDNSIETKSISELIAAEAKKISELNLCEVRFDSSPIFVNASYQTKTIVLRITQEFIQNSIKHAKCSLITIDLKSDDNSIQLTLQDDGIGFDITQTKGNGIGLANMKKRTELIHGTFALESRPNHGTQLTVILPL